MPTTYQRPVAATLHVQLENGETFAAGPEDLARFGYVDRLDAHMRFRNHLAQLFLNAGLIERDKHLVNCRLNPLRYLSEIAIGHPDLLTHPEMADTDATIVGIEKALRALDVVDELADLIRLAGAVMDASNVTDALRQNFDPPPTAFYAVPVDALQPILNRLSEARRQAVTE